MKTIKEFRSVGTAMPRAVRRANASKLVLTFSIIALLTTVASGQSEKKIAYGILLDNTGSLRSQFPNEVALAKTLTKHILPRGPVSIFSFASQGVGIRNAAVTRGTEWSQDEGRVLSNLDNIYVQGGQTILLDAIDAMAAALDAKVDAHKDEFQGKVIILITDGEDRASEIKKDALINKLKFSGTSVYAVGLVQALPYNHRGTAEDLLKAITKQTGGRVVFPKSNQRDWEQALVNDLFPR